MTVKCPYCEYEGRVSSVEAHISGKADEAHRGKVGHGFRESLHQEEDETAESEEPAGSPGWALLAASAVLVTTVMARSSSSREGER